MITNISSKKTTVLKYVLLNVLVMLILIVVQFVFSPSYTQLSNMIGQAKGQMSGATEVQFENYEQDFFFLQNNIETIIETHFVGKHLTHNDEHWQEVNSEISLLFSNFIKTHEDYYQIRIINMNGDELTRVENMGKVTIVNDPSRMQNKKGREYFELALNSAKQRIVYSDISLNREFGQIEIPYRPVLRLSGPLMNKSGEIISVLVVNIDLKHWISGLERELFPEQLLIVGDSDGFFIEHYESALRYTRDVSPDIKITSDFKQVEKYGEFLNEYESLHASGDSVYGDISDLYVNNGQLGLTVGVFYPKSFVTSRLLFDMMKWFMPLVFIIFVFTLIIVYLDRTKNRAVTLSREFELFKKVIDSTNDVLVIIDNAARIVNYNDALHTALGVPKGNYVGNDFVELLDKHIFVNIEHDLNNGMSKNSIVTFEFGPFVDEQKKFFKVKVVPIIDEIENLDSKYYSLVFTDVTDEKFALIQVEEINHSLEATVFAKTQDLQVAKERAEAVSHQKSKFISLVSHEMRTPLNGIVGALTLMKRDDNKIVNNEYFSMAENSALVLSTLVNDILDLTKVEAGKLELNYKVIDIQHEIDAIISTLSVAIFKKDLQLFIDCSDLYLVDAQIDRLRFKQIMTNLVTNATKFTEAGYIKLVFSSQQRNDKMWLSVSVQDTGIGLTDEEITKLFQDFNQANNEIAEQYGGTGLGLSICKQLVELMGGEIEVTSKKGSGATFSFTIPIEEYTEISSDVLQSLANCKVAVLTKDKTKQQILNRSLKKYGCKTTTDVVFVNGKVEDSDVTHVIVDKQALKQLLSEHTIIDAAITQMDDNGALVFNVLDGTLTTEPLHKVIKACVLDIDIIHHFVHVAEQGNMLGVKQGNDQAVRSSEIQPFAHNYHVLVVDDNDVNLKVAKYLLEGFNLTVDTAKDGEIALQLMQTNQVNYQLVLMDCNMPNLNGYDTTIIIRQGGAGDKYKDIPVIAMTANAMADEKNKCEASGMNGFVGKPVNDLLLFRTVKKYLGAETEHGEEPKETNKEEGFSQATPTAIDPSVMDVDSGINETWDDTLLLEKLGGNAEVFAEIVECFLEETEQNVQHLKQAYQDNDIEKIRFHSHSIKGAAKDIELTDLAKIMFELEQAAKNNEEAVVAKLHSVALSASANAIELVKSKNS